MGLMNKVKSGVKNVASATEEAINNAEDSHRIRGKTEEISEFEQKIGHAIYELYSNGDGFSDDVTEMCKRIDTLYEDIEALKRKKEDDSAKAASERQERRDSS